MVIGTNIKKATLLNVPKDAPSTGTNNKAIKRDAERTQREDQSCR